MFNNYFLSIIDSINTNDNKHVNKANPINHLSNNFIKSLTKINWHFAATYEIEKNYCKILDIKKYMWVWRKLKWNRNLSAPFIILVNDQLDVQFFSMYLFIFLALYMFLAHRAHHQERQIVSIQPLVAVGLRAVCRSEVHFRPAHGTATDTEWQLPEAVLTQFVSPDDEHDVLETCRELKM